MFSQVDRWVSLSPRAGSHNDLLFLPGGLAWSRVGGPGPFLVGTSDSSSTLRAVNLFDEA